jgi:hypothetical protein
VLIAASTPKLPNRRQKSYRLDWLAKNLVLYSGQIRKYECSEHEDSSPVCTKHAVCKTLFLSDLLLVAICRCIYQVNATVTAPFSIVCLTFFSVVKRVSAGNPLLLYFLYSFFLLSLSSTLSNFPSRQDFCLRAVNVLSTSDRKVRIFPSSYLWPKKRAKIVTSFRQLCALYCTVINPVLNAMRLCST